MRRLNITPPKEEDFGYEDRTVGLDYSDSTVRAVLRARYRRQWCVDVRET